MTDTTPDTPVPDGHKAVYVKRQFAVVLEDCFRVIVPADTVTDEAWATDVMDDLYQQANTGNPNVRLVWEDEHKDDLDFPEDVVIVEEAQ